LKTTVIIPTFNRPEWLEETLNCFEHQVLDEGNEYDVIVVSDGCDKTVEWFKESKFAHNELFRIYNSRCYDRYGIRLCWNIGVHFSDADQIITIADDCLVNDDYIYQHQRFFEPYGMLMARIYHIHPKYRHRTLKFEGRLPFSPQLVKAWGYEVGENYNSPHEHLWGAELPIGCYCGATMSFCRKGIIALGGVNEFLTFDYEGEIITEYRFDDCDTGIRWAKKYGKIRFLTDAMVYHKGVSSGDEKQDAIFRVQGDNRKKIDSQYRLFVSWLIQNNPRLIQGGGKNYFDEHDWNKYVVE